jgi:hypothetical protein
MHPDQHDNISNCPVCQVTTLANVEALGTWKVLERQQILTLFNPATRFEPDESDEESETADDDKPEDEQNETLVK